jgi:hypothetical protein
MIMHSCTVLVNENASFVAATMHTFLKASHDSLAAIIRTMPETMSFAHGLNPFSGL